MIGYKDKDWCVATCKNTKCDRNIKHIRPGGREYTNYLAWGATFGEDGGPVWMADFSENCDIYIPENQ